MALLLINAPFSNQVKPAREKTDQELQLGSINYALTVRIHTTLSVAKNSPTSAKPRKLDWGI